MQIEVSSHSKYRAAPFAAKPGDDYACAPGKPGDDIPLVIPGVVFGVMDGATDARGTLIDGIAAGRLAALTVAEAASRLLLDPQSRELPGPDIVARLATALRDRTAGLDIPIPPSTTLSLAIDCGDDWRFLSLGDSGLRLNGTEVLQRGKIIDDVSTHARIAVFRHLMAEARTPDETELATRRAIFLGLDHAVAEGVIPAALRGSIIAGATRATGLDAHAGSVEAFLRAGICGQFRYANSDHDPLSFDTMDGGTPKLSQMIDTRRPKAAVRSIEVFSDGYPTLPAETTVAAWEVTYAATEAQDFHKIDSVPAIKGSTTTEFFDDRTVVIVT